MYQYIDKVKQSLLPATLYIVGTPIGNLADISLRALAVLESVDVICAEDTRVTHQLLAAYGLNNKIINMRQQNEVSIAQKVIDLLSQGLMVAQVSDAGMPAICDPGYRLVREVRNKGFTVFTVPGPCALIAALSLSGMTADQFYFSGFLPAKRNEKQQVLQQLGLIECTVVCYETPHRILETLNQICELMPQRKMVLTRELTKKFETVLTGLPSELLASLISDSKQQKGEMVLILDALDAADAVKISAEVVQLVKQLIPVFPTKKIVELVANITQINKKSLYELVLKQKNDHIK